MSTLGTLKARIAADLERSDMTTQIGEAIADAIAHHNVERFYFNETRAVTFPTVASTREYAHSAMTDAIDGGSVVPVKIDAAIATVSGMARQLDPIDPVEMELLHDTAVSTGQPSGWCYFNQRISIYPLPDDAYTIRLVGHFKKAAPAADDTANNVWMTEAFELIRCRAKAYMFEHVLEFPEKVPGMLGLEAVALDRLRRETTRRTGTGRIIPTSF